ncbi:MAG: hypothetical protein SCARUB_01526 [Candidatus Scalindua rubra]|uniref:LITAF domain-containing protein n=1 Tax=Candidatus Scalindua rubra TaxID=1872076 RepID=A0A1E3XCJ1_9BACT|nr:MAG: hypothetical protein SCARUB_01526 [Candidatus Scalindua rubra]
MGNILVDNIGRNLERVLDIVKDPEHFLLEKYYGLEVPKGFRIDLFAARKFRLICGNIKQFKSTNLKMEDNWLGREKIMGIIPVRKIREVVTVHSPARHPRKLVCPYCEKIVIPKRLHKLNFADIVLFFFSGGIWAIILFVLYFLIRRCPVCNYSLRGFKPLSEERSQ